MKELSKKGEQYFLKWQNKRKNKWRYIFINGCLYYGLSVAIIAFLIHSLRLGNIQLSWFIRYAFIFMFSGIFVALRRFNQTDKIYLSSTDDSEIIDGVKALETEGAWSFENLKISRENEDVITVQNDLFWFDGKTPSKENTEECFKQVYGDFNRLKKNADFDKYLKNKKIKLLIVDNSGSNIPLFVNEVQG